MKYLEWGQPLLIVSAGRFGKRLGFLNVTFNDYGVLTSWSGNSLLLSDEIPPDPAIEVTHSVRVTLGITKPTVSSLSRLKWRVIM